MTELTINIGAFRVVITRSGSHAIKAKLLDQKGGVIDVAILPRSEFLFAVGLVLGRLEPDVPTP